MKEVPEEALYAACKVVEQFSASYQSTKYLKTTSTRLTVHVPCRAIQSTMRPGIGHVLTVTQALAALAALGVTIYVTSDSKSNGSQGVFKHTVIKLGYITFGPR